LVVGLTSRLLAGFPLAHQETNEPENGRSSPPWLNVASSSLGAA
jgi:hypothetical protein